MTIYCLLVCVGIKTTQDAKFYALSANFESFSNKGITMVIQFTVKHEQKIDCGGGYVKVRLGSVCRVREKDFP